MLPLKRVIKRDFGVETVFILNDDPYYFHREDGPAFIREYKDGKRIEAWHFNGLRHRYSGPSYNNGNLYHVMGNLVNNEVETRLSERDYIWETMNEQEKWELDMFMRTLG